MALGSVKWTGNNITRASDIFRKLHLAVETATRVIIADKVTGIWHPDTWGFALAH